MLFGWFYYDWTVLVLLPAMLLAFWAQWRVQSTFRQYGEIPTRMGRTAAEAARQMLNANGLADVEIEQVRGHLTDHYDPRTRKLYLSESVYNNRSAAAIGVACHEAGHAIQHATAYGPLGLRMRMVPVCNVGSGMAMPLFLIGLFLGAGGYPLMVAGIACFSLATLFQLVTLPVEFDASRRALEEMQGCHILYDNEIEGARQVLNAAAMTYVAALASSLMSLLRLVLIANRRR